MNKESIYIYIYILEGNWGKINADITSINLYVPGYYQEVKKITTQLQLLQNYAHFNTRL